MSPTEKDLFLKAYAREFETTMRVLNAYPRDKLDLTADMVRSARDIASSFIGEQAVVDMAMSGNIDFSDEPVPPSSLDELIAMFQGLFQKNSSDGRPNGFVQDTWPRWPVGLSPKEYNRVRSEVEPVNRVCPRPDNRMQLTVCHAAVMLKKEASCPRS